MDNNVIRSVRQIVSTVDKNKINQRPNKSDVIFHVIFYDQDKDVIDIIRNMFSFDKDNIFSMKVGNLKMRVGIKNNDVAIQIVAYANREMYAYMFKTLFMVVIEYIEGTLQIK